MAIIFEPSRGGTGMRLKTARSTLRKTINPRKAIASGLKIVLPNLIRMATIRATTILEAGPARATFRGPYRGSLYSRVGSYGTGFAQPRIMGELAMNRKRGNKSEPTTSKCLIGFRVNLPASFAVSSPSLSAIAPWATS